MSNYEPTRFSYELVSRLRGIIAQYDISQVDLATLCDVSQSQFSKIIRDTRPITVDQVAAICAALDVDLAELIKDVEEFLQTRSASIPTPVMFVIEGERVEPLLVNDSEQDVWARAADGRFSPPAKEATITTMRLNVPAPGETQDDYAAAASERDGQDETDEGFN